MLRQSVTSDIGANTQTNRCFYLVPFFLSVITHVAVCLYGFKRATLQTTMCLLAGSGVGVS